MGLLEKMLLRLNRLFPRAAHPLNLALEGGPGCAEVAYGEGARVLRHFDAALPVSRLLRGAQVLDLCCGDGGLSAFYAERGARRVFGADLDEGSLRRGASFYRARGVAAVAAEASRLPFREASFDLVLFNHSMEHVARPLGTMAEAYRVLRPGGYFLVNFVPYAHPDGGHLTDAIGIPYVHFLFPERVRLAAYQRLVARYADAEARLSFRTALIGGRRVFSYTNGMTVARFRRLLRSCRSLGFHLVHFHLEPLPGRRVAPFARILFRLPVLRELFTFMVVAVLAKPASVPRVVLPGGSQERPVGHPDRESGEILGRPFAFLAWKKLPAGP